MPSTRTFALLVLLTAGLAQAATAPNATLAAPGATTPVAPTAAPPASPTVKPADLRLEGTFESNTMRADETAVCRDVLAFYQSRVAPEPPLGRKPFVIHKAPDDTPRACLNGLPRQYDINLTCINARLYSQIVYQLAHEVGHVYINPYKGGWFSETVCGAMSYVCLADLAVKWKTEPPYPNWKSYAPHFAEYREAERRKALEKAGLSGVEKAADWLRTDLPAFVRQKQVDRPQQFIGAMVVEQALREHPKSWGALTRLGEATSDRGTVDFARWRDLAKPDERPLVESLMKSFAAAAAAQEK